MTLRSMLLLAVLTLTAHVVFAQDYPNRPIRLIVPFAAGGGSDFVGRLIGQKLTDQMGQTVVVDNRPGAASLVGTQIAANAAADGYTLLLADSGFTINIAFFKDPKYDALKSFDPVSVVAEAPYILVVNPGLPYAGSLKEFVAAAKAQPGKLAIGSAGSGSGTHMIAPALTDNLGRAVVVDNRPGASGSIAMEIAARAAPDGYTLAIFSVSQVIYAELNKTNYDMIETGGGIIATPSF